MSEVRWLGSKLLDVFSKEFGAFPRAYYAAAIRSGRILVNGARVDADDCVLRAGDLVALTHGISDGARKASLANFRMVRLA